GPPLPDPLTGPSRGIAPVFRAAPAAGGPGPQREDVRPGGFGPAQRNWQILESRLTLRGVVVSFAEVRSGRRGVECGRCTGRRTRSATSELAATRGSRTS